MTDNYEMRLRALEEVVFATPKQAQREPWQELLDRVSQTWGGHEVTYDVIVSSVLNDLAIMKREETLPEMRKQLLAQIVDACNRYYVDPPETLGNEYERYPSVEGLLGASMKVRDIDDDGVHMWEFDLSRVRRYALKWLIQMFEGES